MKQESHYPDAPGYKVTGTSQEAALAMAGRAVALRDRVLAILKRVSATADECAYLMDESVLSIRPRLSELFNRSLIEPTGERRKNSSGHSASVWRAVPECDPTLTLCPRCNNEWGRCPSGDGESQP